MFWDLEVQLTLDREQVECRDDDMWVVQGVDLG